MRVVLVLAAAFAVATSASAQARQGPGEDGPALDRPVPAHLTLEQAISRAVETSHILAELRAREGAAAAVLDERKASDMPSLSAQAGYRRTNHVEEFGVPQPNPPRIEIIYPDVPDNWRTRLDLAWPIYTGGRTGALEHAADAERLATGKDLESARADLVLETTRAFWALVTATESVRVVGESITRIEAQHRDVKARFDTGFLPPNDVLTVATRVSQQRTLLLDTQNQRDSARAVLARLIGARVDADFEPEATLAEGAMPIPATEQVVNLAAQARSARADRQALLFRVQGADARIDAAKSGNRPSVNIAAGYDYARPNPVIFPRQDIWHTSWDAGINVSWTLWNGGRTGAEVAEAKQQAAATRERLAEFDSQIALEVRQRQLDLTTAEAQVRTAGEAVGTAMEARRVVQERVSAGVATTTDLLDAQQDQLEAELQRTRALANVKLAQARLARALGR
jgi:outer membrane protein